MKEDAIYMSGKEIDRFGVIMASIEGRMRRKEAAEVLKVTDRQVRRLIKNYKRIGKQAFISRKRGAVSNNRISTAKRDEALCLITGHYYDFGPTFAAE
ncbi:MAG TPA: helix-turn-helix domain-containing protein, partial [bacterium]|nr:helix-turn-helix domain-containing protein [bacterium]